MHPLDRPIWTALTTEQAGFAETHGVARRFPAAVTTLSAVAELDAVGWRSLEGLLCGDAILGLFLPCGTVLHDLLVEVSRVEILQMLEVDAPAREDAPALELGDDDVAEMIALAQLTKPGPFGHRTRELGTFLGVRIDGRLVAMAGQRLKVPGFTEISAVCTHPEWSGRGYAAHLTGELARRIRAEGVTPFLHVRSDNARAIGVYQRLGFRERRRFEYVVAHRAAP